MYCVWPRCAQGVWKGGRKARISIHPSWRQRGSVCSVHSPPPWCLTFTHTLSGGHIQYTCVCACILCLDLSVVSQTEILMRGDFFKTRKWRHLQEEISSELSDRSAAWVHLLLPSASTCRSTGVRLSACTCIRLIRLSTARCFLQEETLLCSCILLAQSLHCSEPPVSSFFIPPKQIIASYTAVALRIGSIRWHRNEQWNR